MKKTVIAVCIVFILMAGVARCFRVDPPPEPEKPAQESKPRPGLARLLFGRKGPAPPSRKENGRYSVQFPRQAAVNEERLKRSQEVIREAEETRYFAAAERLRRSGDYEQALEQYDRALSRRPENGFIKQRKKLAQLRLHRRQAQENGYLERAYEHYENGRLGSAEETARLALEQAGENRYIAQMAYDVLAGCYRGTDRKQAAILNVASREILENLDEEIGKAYFYLEETD